MQLNLGDLLEGRYRIEAPIARGGMSTVYRCVDTRLGRNVAAKVMHEEYAGDPIFAQRFRREARSMAHLSHPNLVGVYDFNSDGDHVFLIMELITGGTLRELLAERGAMPDYAASAVMRSVLTGLAAVHNAGMVHRDLKPDNILIDGNHQVKLSDFGLVRAASASQGKSNQIVGTVAYLSPEQVSGDDITTASDVYSAGIVLFELLTGTTPFNGDTPLKHAYARLDADVPKPSNVCRKCNCTFLACSRNDFCFALIIFRIENLILNPFFIQVISNHLIFSNTARTNEHWTPLSVIFFNRLCYCLQLAFFSFVYQIFVVFASNWFVRRHDHDVE